MTSRLRLAVIFGCLCFGLASVGAEQTPQQAREHLQRLRQQVEAVQMQLSRERGDLDDAEAALRESEKAVAKAVRDLNRHRQAVADQRHKLAELRGEATTLAEALAADRRRLAEQVRLAHRLGGQSALEVLLAQEDPGAISRMLVYYDYVNRARTERMARLSRRLERLAELRRRAREEAEALARMQAEQARKVGRLKSAREKRQTTLAALKGRVGDRLEELAELERHEARLGSLVAALQRSPSVRASPPDGDSEVRAGWPVEGSVLAEYGSPRRGGRLRWHGLLIGAAEGAEVKAAAAGRVVFADWLPHYGLVLIVQHARGYLTLYGHNQALYKNVGDKVAADEVIARVGVSGGRQQAALYFEVRKSGKPVDPAVWLSARRH